MEERLERLQKKALSLPMLPGVYIMRNKQKEIIYIGKAKALKNRVSSYFASQENLWIKVKQMVSNVEDFDYIICDSEFEALVLECSLINTTISFCSTSPYALHKICRFWKAATRP